MIIGIFELFPGEIGVGEGVDVTKEEIAEGIKAVTVEDFDRIDDIADTFAHFLAGGEDVAVDGNVAGEGQVETEEDGGPSNGVEAEDIFTDELSRGGPPIADVLVGVAEDGEVVGESINPDIHDLRIVVWDRDAPGKMFLWAGDRDVGSIGKEFKDFLLAKGGEDAEFVLLDFSTNGVLEVGDAKIVIFLSEFLIGFLMVGAESGVFVVFFLSNEAFAAFAVPTVIFSRVNMWGELLPDFLAALDVAKVGSANEVSIADVEFFDESAKLVRVLFGIGFDGEATLESFAVNFVAVFVGADLETHFVALVTAIACKSICEKVVHSVTDMGITVDIGDCGADIYF